MKIDFVRIKHSDPVLRKEMSEHYSKPLGFVGRVISYAVFANGVRYGSCIGGSAVYYLTVRDQYFGVTRENLRNIVNNTFFHVSKVDGRYPIRNFTSKIIGQSRSQIVTDWQAKYGDEVIGFETLVELPRTGELYLKDGWTEIGITKGYTCKRSAEDVDISTDSWTGRRVWDTQNLRPKRILVRRV